MMKNQKFKAILKRMSEINKKKSHDYARTDNPYSNFEDTANIADISVDEVFMTLIGVKLARLQELLRTGKTPNFESIEDTKLDLAIYAALWASYNYGDKK